MKTATATKIEEVKPKKTRKKPVLKIVTVDERQSQYRTLRLMVNNLYDIQRLRLQAEGRHNRKKGNVIQLDAQDIAALEAHSGAIEGFENSCMSAIKAQLRQMPFYREFLKEFDGVGEVGAAVILSQFDIQKADTVSKMWAFAGLRPMPCRRCKECQNVVVEHTGAYKHDAYAKSRKPGQAADDGAVACSLTVITESQTFKSGKAQKPTKGEKLPYNAWLRSKLVGAIGSAQITNKTRWREVYDGYKHRKLSQGWGASDGHRHNAAVRYMVKMMLLEIWQAWRTFEGLPVRPSYHEEKLGHVHSG